MFELIEMSSDKRGGALASPSNDSVIGGRADVAGQKFMSQKAEQYYAVRYESEFSKFLNLSSSKLDRIHRVYPRDYVERDISSQDKMWTAVLSLHQEVFYGDGQWSEYRKNKLLRDLHGNFFQLATKQFISRPNFECCFLMASRGYRHRTIGDTRLVNFLDSVYTSFDALSNGSVDWRRFLFYFHFTLQPTKPAKEQLLSAFSKIRSKSCMNLEDLGLILFPLVKADAASDVLCAMDDAWAQVVACQQQLDKNFEPSKKLTIDTFQQMLELDNMQHFFAQSKRMWGRGRIFPVHVCQWEDEIYNETLLSLVKTTRREESITNKLHRDARRIKLNVLTLWLKHAKFQSSLRRILSMFDQRMKVRMKKQGLTAFLQQVARHNAALELQRVGRGLLGRIKARYCWLIYSSATSIQTRYRMYVAKSKLDALSLEYNWAIVEVQRHIRGALGRRLAFRKLMTIVEQQYLNNVKERERLESERGMWCLIRLQSFWRRKIATIEVDKLRKMKQREILVRRAMETDRDIFLRERQIYERQLEAFYRSMKEDHINNERVQSKVAKDKVKVRTLRRRIKNDEIINAEPDNSEQLATEKWKSDWQSKIVLGVKNKRAYCIHCLDEPDNAVEKLARATIRKRVKGRVFEVLARAKERDIPMETKEARAVAREEIIHIIGEEERDRLSSEMKIEFKERERLKEEARLLAEARKREACTRDTIYAVSMVSMACRKWLARRELRRLCLVTYEKKFHEWNHAFFYRNKVTGEVSWEKPKAMGEHEIPAKDEWKILRDAHNFPYYFNPFLIEMRWTPPVNEDMCCGMVAHTWWREYPVREGRCPNFSWKLNEDDGKRYCRDCLPGNDQK